MSHSSSLSSSFTSFPSSLLQKSRKWWAGSNESSLEIDKVLDESARHIVAHARENGAVHARNVAYEANTENITHGSLITPSYTLKILICGAPSVGKTAILEKFERRYQKWRKQGSAGNHTVMGSMIASVLGNGAKDSVHTHLSNHTASPHLDNVMQPSGSPTVAPQFVTYPLQSILSPHSLRKLQMKLPQLAASLGSSQHAGAASPINYNIQFIDMPHSHFNVPYLSNVILSQVHGVAVVFDISDPKTIYAVDQWRKRVAEYNAEIMQHEDGTTPQLKHILLLAHKAEKKPHILSPRALSDYIRDSHYIKWYMTSLKWRDSVEEAFEYLAVRVLRYWGKKSAGIAPGSGVVQRMIAPGQSGGTTESTRQGASQNGLHRSASGTLDEMATSPTTDVPHVSTSPDSETDSLRPTNARPAAQDTTDPFSHELANIPTEQVDELMEQSPYTSTNQHSQQSTPLDPENVALKIQAIISFQDELSSFYRLLKRRLNDYLHLLKEQQHAFKKDSFSKFCLTHDQMQLILSQLKHEQQVAEDSIQNILQIYEQFPNEETMDRRCKKQFAELKRTFYISTKEKWSALWHSIRSFMFLHNNAEALQQGSQSGDSKCEVVPVLPKSIEELMQQMQDDRGIIQGSGGEAESILTVAAPGAVQQNSAEMSHSEYNFKFLNQALDIYSYDPHYTAIHSIMEQSDAR